PPVGSAPRCELSAIRLLLTSTVSSTQRSNGRLPSLGHLADASHRGCSKRVRADRRHSAAPRRSRVRESGAPEAPLWGSVGCEGQPWARTPPRPVHCTGFFRML